MTYIIQSNIPYKESTAFRIIDGWYHYDKKEWDPEQTIKNLPMEALQTFLHWHHYDQLFKTINEHTNRTCMVAAHIKNVDTILMNQMKTEGALLDAKRQEWLTLLKVWFVNSDDEEYNVCSNHGRWVLMGHGSFHRVAK